MGCRGICTRHRAQRTSGFFGRYATGQKRCQICAIFMRWDGLWCPCCGCRVRTKPRNSKFKQKLKMIRKQHNKNKNREKQPLLIYKKNDVTVNSSSSPFVN
jgi:hypothetical protein